GRLHAEGHRRARVDVDDRRAELERARRDGEAGEQRERIRTVRLSFPESVEAGPFDFGTELDDAPGRGVRPGGELEVVDPVSARSNVSMASNERQPFSSPIASIDSEPANRAIDR